MYSKPSARVILITVAVVGLVVFVGAVSMNMARLPVNTVEHNECRTPVLRITDEDAIRIMMASYDPNDPNEPPTAWNFTLFRLVKFCASSEQWWSSINGDTWERVSSTEIPQAVKTYAMREDLVFYVVMAYYRFYIPKVDESWVDGVSSELVTKFRVAT